MSGRAARLAILRGVLDVARFRASGLLHFGGGTDSLLASLAPLMAFPLVAALVVLLTGWDSQAMAELLSVVDAVLVQLVVSEALARRWGREADWGRYATAMNWSQWVMPPAAMLIALGLGVLVSFGLAMAWAAPLAGLALLAYALGLQWFVARHALALGPGRAAALVAATNACTAIVVLVPTQLRLLT